MFFHLLRVILSVRIVALLTICSLFPFGLHLMFFLLFLLLLPFELFLLPLEFQLLALDFFQFGLGLLDLFELLSCVLRFDPGLLLLFKPFLFSNEPLLLLDLRFILTFDALKLFKAGLLGCQLSLIRHFDRSLLLLFLFLDFRPLLHIV